MRRLLVLAALLTVFPAAAFSQRAFLEATLWCELQPLIQEEQTYPLPREEARRRILEEARRLFSAMVYGLKFTYTPGDRARQVADEFLLEPVAEIPWGDPNLRIVDAYERDNRLMAKVEYDLAAFQEARRRAWGSTAIPVATGVGTSNLFLAPPPEGKRRSFEAALKEALRSYLRPIHFNKPRSISGDLLVWEPPEVIIRAGTYQTTLQVKLRLQEVRDYSLF